MCVCVCVCLEGVEDVWEIFRAVNSLRCRSHCKTRSPLFPLTAELSDNEQQRTPAPNNESVIRAKPISGWQSKYGLNPLHGWVKRYLQGLKPWTSLYPLSLLLTCLKTKLSKVERNLQLKSFPYETEFVIKRTESPRTKCNAHWLKHTQTHTHAYTF